ncbi:hypothetical protein XENOCAPTIV_009107 [Xenoophorus captivus]|uniref:Uncharacterized protein n=1 Tax=Xenoophorus captivus TaxID=1517983 RepID=A0ABV0S7W5_9TELE
MKSHKCLRIPFNYLTAETLTNYHLFHFFLCKPSGVAAGQKFNLPQLGSTNVKSGKSELTVRNPPKMKGFSEIQQLHTNSPWYQYCMRELDYLSKRCDTCFECECQGTTNSKHPVYPSKTFQCWEKAFASNRFLLL